MVLYFSPEISSHIFNAQSSLQLLSAVSLLRYDYFCKTDLLSV